MAGKATRETLHAARVLVVEDDPDLRDVLETALADEGYAVATAPNGEAALALLDADGFRPHVILLDMKMPAMDGTAFAREYRSRPGPHAPIIVVTASAAHATAARKISPAAVVLKPFDLGDLLEKVASAVRTR